MRKQVSCLLILCISLVSAEGCIAQNRYTLPGSSKEQIDFTSLSYKASDLAVAAPNQIQADQIEEKWGRKYCASIQDLQGFNDWIGKVNHIMSSGYFEVDIGGLRFAQNIDAKDPLFQSISNLRIDQRIKISGVIDKDYELTTCVGWASTIDEIMVKFSSIRPASEQ